jgi:hypothetical protein
MSRPALLAFMVSDASCIITGQLKVKMIGKGNLLSDRQREKWLSDERRLFFSTLQPCSESSGISGIHARALQGSCHRKLFEDIYAVWGLFHGVCQIRANVVKNLVVPVTPEKAARKIVHLSVVRRIGWRPILPIASGQFFLAELPHTTHLVVKFW